VAKIKGGSKPRNAIELLKKDHTEVAGLLDRIGG
jgi:hypothetical protein